MFTSSEEYSVFIILCCFFFFFKQKTAYEMRISDWSSDVCSSDLYGRTSSVNSAETMRVAQYHVPLGAEKALITLSYIEGDQQAIAAHNRLTNSIVIR